MYSVAELAEMYGTSRDWMYKTISKQEFDEYLDKTSKSKKLMVEGLNLLNYYLSQKRMPVKDNSNNESVAENTDFQGELIEELKKTIAELKHDKEYLKNTIDNLNNTIQEGRDKFFNELEEQRKTLLLLTTKNDETQKQPRKSLFTRLFK